MTLVPCWLLLAVSSVEQIETLAHQQAMAEATAAAQGWRIDRVFGVGRDGVGTGKHGPRAILLRMIAELRATEPAHRPAWVWMRRVDRVGRGRIAESQLALHEISDLGPRIWDQDIGEVRLDSASDQIIAALKSGLAALENEVRSGKQRGVWARKRAAGLPLGKVPYGLAYGADGMYVAREPQATAVREAFEMGAGGAGGFRIAKHLVATAPPYPYKRGERPVHWDQRRVYRMLANRWYIGTVIDEVTFERARRAREQTSYRPPNRKWPWPLTGAITCYCGRRMIGRATGHRGGVYFRRYYCCPTISLHGGRTRMVRADELEAVFVDRLRSLSADPAEVAAVMRLDRKTAPSLALLDRTLRSFTKKLKEVAEKRAAVFDLHAAGNLRDGDVQERLDALATERDRLQSEASTIEAQARSARIKSEAVVDVVAIVARAHLTWAEATDDERRELATIVAVSLGGLCVEEDGALAFRRPSDPARQLRHALRREH